MSRKVITLLTDFGYTDAYLGSLKGAILSINPSVNLVDITHDILPYDLVGAGFVLRSAANNFPQGTIHLTVVDPGVGSARRPLIVITPPQIFVGPDNGIFSQVLGLDSLSGDEGIVPRYIPLPKNVQAYCLDNSQYWNQPVSETFHGRDVFGPVAAYLSLGVSPDVLGKRIDSMLYIPFPEVKVSKSSIEGSIIVVDHFGNLVTNIRSSLINTGETLFRIGGHSVNGLSHSYSERGPLLAIIGSHGFVEIALRNGNAAEFLGVGVGDGIIVEVV